MGLNLDLVRMLGVPKTLLCPQCGKDVETTFDDYDVECGAPNKRSGEWSLRVHCHECEHDFEHEFNLVEQREVLLKFAYVGSLIHESVDDESYCGWKNLQVKDWRRAAEVLGIEWDGETMRTRDGFLPWEGDQNDCDECGGDGVLYADVNGGPVEEDCPYCDGTGKEKKR